jgi:DNA-binding MarR family transcriptional regulator
MQVERMPAGKSATELILSIFRANGRLLEEGDRLAAEHGLSSARWQVLGAVALSDRPITVPQIARRMGLTRQSVHATSDRLIRDQLLEPIPNEDHRRSALLRLTEHGKQTYRSLDRAQAGWVSQLIRGISRSDIDRARTVIDELVDRLDAGRSERAQASSDRSIGRRARR